MNIKKGGSGMVKVKEDLTGWIMKEHGIPESRLTVVEQVDDYISPKGRKVARYKCLCECGNYIIVMAKDIKSGYKLSCGCHREKRKGTRLYSIWQGIKSRCYNPNTTHYNKYGGRGIVMCDEWKNDFLLFKQWALLNGYKDNLTIDRVDVDGNYEPTNCRWATMVTQSNNRRDNCIVEYNNESHTLSEWCRITGIKVITLWDRLNLLGWSIEKALTTKNANEKLIEYCGEIHNLRQWAKIFNVNYTTFRGWLKKGETIQSLIEKGVISWNI